MRKKELRARTDIGDGYTGVNAKKTLTHRRTRLVLACG
jgi:hypothetical protein